MFHSCYSYKTVNNEKHDLELNQNYKVVTTNEITLKGKLISISNDTLTLTKKRKNTSVTFLNVKSIKKRKFSYLKTIGLPITIITISFAIVLESVSDLDIGPKRKPSSL